MKIGILGTGPLAEALGQLLINEGYFVMFGGETPTSGAPIVAKLGTRAETGSYTGAGHFGEILLYTAPYKEYTHVLNQVNSFTGKVLVDCSNPLVSGDTPTLAMGTSTSGSEQIAKAYPEAQVVKAFNMFSAEFMLDLVAGNDTGLSMPICGDDETAKTAVTELVKAAGFTPYDAGPLEHARFIEPLAVLMARQRMATQREPRLVLG
ncbi:MAG: NAD(P)-binding domain-containing protein [Bacteroidota bacterium]